MLTACYHFPVCGTRRSFARKRWRFEQPSCGHWLVEHMASVETSGAKVFISYSRADVDFADQIVLALVDRGFDPLIDRQEIDAAEQWKDRLTALIFNCSYVVFVVSEASAKSSICQWEVELAASFGRRIVPVLPGPVEWKSLPDGLSSLNAIHFYRDVAIPGSGFYDGLQKLDRALRLDLNWVRLGTKYDSSASDWKRDRSADRLLRGSTLEEALIWLSETPAGMSVLSTTKEFIAASEQAELLRQGEAKALIAERETALKQAEQAFEAKAAADKRLRTNRLLIMSLAAGALVFLSVAAASVFQTMSSQLNERRARASEAEAVRQATEATRQRQIAEEEKERVKMLQQRLAEANQRLEESRKLGLTATLLAFDGCMEERAVGLRDYKECRQILGDTR